MFRAGVARTRLTPFWGVELTGWGYYIERRWQRVHDHLNATALAVDDGERPAVLVALDLMVDRRAVRHGAPASGSGRRRACRRSRFS